MRMKSTLKNIFTAVTFLVISSYKAQENPNCLITLDKNLSPKDNGKNKIGEIINIKDKVNCFDWDTLIVQMAINKKETAEKQLGIKIPFEYDYSWGSENVAMLLFVKDKVVLHYILQKPADKSVSDETKSVKAYSFINLLNNYGNNIYAIIPRDKAIFKTYPVVYQNKVTETEWALKNGMSVKVDKN